MSRRELSMWLDERRARLMVRVVRRTFRQQPNRIDRALTRLIEKAAG